MLTDQPLEVERFLKFNLVYILTTLVADGMGLIFGSVFNPVVRINQSISQLIQHNYNKLLINRMAHLSAQQRHLSYLPSADLLRSTATYQNRCDFYRICHQ